MSKRPSILRGTTRADAIVMLNLEKILVPTDFSDSSLIAVSQAGELARHFHSAITLLHINEVSVLHSLNGPLGIGIRSAATETPEHLSRLQQHLNAFATDELSGVSVKRILCCGDPATLIVRRACEEKSDLIFMPTHGGGIFRRFLLGSVTAKVLHDAACPVWTGAHLEECPALKPADIHHVMCAVDFGPQSSNTIQWAAFVASALQARLTVVHAAMDAPPNLPGRYMFQWHEEAHWGAEERIRTLLADLRIQAEVLVVSDGDVPKSLSAAVTNNKADLLVIGRSPADNVSRRLGSHAYAVLTNAPCPVVSV